MFRMSFYKKNPSEKIKEATLELLATNGYDDISMRKIAKEADVALGQLTYYYKSKNSLIISVVKETLEAFYYEFEDKIMKSDSKLDDIVKDVGLIINEDTNIDSLLITIISQSKFNKKLKQILSEFWEKIISLITKCYKDEIKDITDEEANLKARFLIGTCIENIVENMLDVNINLNKDKSLIIEGRKKLGEI